jgi:hypothetical protein
MSASTQDLLETVDSHHKRRSTMLARTLRPLFNLVAVGAFVAMAVANMPLRSEELAANLRPVGPHEPILASIGEKRIVASFAREFGHCALNASVWDSIEAETDSAVRIGVSLSPGQVVHIESLKHGNESLGLQCGDDANTLPLVSAN